MTYRVWEGRNKHDSHWAMRKRRRMTLISVHGEKKGESYAKTKRGRREAKIPLTLRRRRRRQQGNATGPDQSLQTLHSS